MQKCLHHEAIASEIKTGERDRGELWEAVSEIRKDIKSMLSKVGIIVGVITTLNTLAIILIDILKQHP